jgi:hypothetical protein
MSNVLSEEKKQQVIALGRLGWSLRRIEQATGVHRETAGAYLKAVGIAVRPPGGWGRRAMAKPANGNGLHVDVSPEPRELYTHHINRNANKYLTWRSASDKIRGILKISPCLSSTERHEYGQVSRLDTGRRIIYPMPSKLIGLALK